jgi:hypothetical protein
LGSGPKTHPLGGNERIGYGPHSEIFSSYGSEAESTICVVRARSVPEHSSHSVRIVLFRRSILLALRHHTITVQCLANTPGLWDGWTLPERNIGTDGDGDARDVAAAGSHGKGRVGSARTCGGRSAPGVHLDHEIRYGVARKARNAYPRFCEATLFGNCGQRPKDCSQGQRSN